MVWRLLALTGHGLVHGAGLAPSSRQASPHIIRGERRPAWGGEPCRSGTEAGGFGSHRPSRQRTIRAISASASRFSVAKCGTWT